jgi:hypothetical protein
MASEAGHGASMGGRALRAVFIDAGVHYVDERGEHSGLVSEHVHVEEDRCRLAVVSNTESWLRSAIGLGDELLGLARRVGDVDAWGCTSGWFGGANPGPNVAARTIKTITGRRPPKPASGPFTRPNRGRWSVRQVFQYERGRDVPTVAVWHLGFTPNPQFWSAWCDAITSGNNAPTLIVPDSPITRQMVEDWNTGRLTVGRRTWTGDQVKDYPGSAAYVRPRVSAVLEPDRALTDGAPLVAAMDFLRARHQLRISPFDLLRDRLMRSQLAPITVADAEWSKAEVAQLGKLRERYARVQDIHAWIDDARAHPPEGIFATGDSYPGSVEACLHAARRAVEFGQLAGVLITSWTGWAPSALERGEIPTVPATLGTHGQLIDWFRQTFALAVSRGLIDPGWYQAREKWHSASFKAFPGKVTDYYEQIYRAEEALASPAEQAILTEPGEFADWYRTVFTLASRAGISATAPVGTP